jgi:DNA-binding NarL/FixJ family response regulator
MSITILLAEDHVVIREGLKALLEAQGDMTVVASVSDGRAAVEEATRLKPNVVVTDISMPQMTGLEATRHIRAASPDTRVVILTMHINAEHVYRALEAGATGYLLKEVAGTELVDAIRAVHAGRRYLGERANEVVVAGYLADKGARSPLQSLSRREREVLSFLVEGHGTSEIAELLHLSVKSIETYRSRLLGKLQIDNLAALVKFAIDQGITKVR